MVDLAPIYGHTMGMYVSIYILSLCMYVRTYV